MLSGIANKRGRAVGFFDFLFGKKEKRRIELLLVPAAPDSAPDSAPAPAPSLEDSFFTLDKPRWFGSYSRSPNGRWIVSWRDTDPTGIRGGHRAGGKGAYLLYDYLDRKVVVKGHMERPNNGHVSDAGIFVLEDWHFGGELSGTFYAFNADGHTLLKKKLSANLLTNAVSPNGLFAACQTVNSKTEDSCKLFLFDLKSGQQLFAATPSAGWTMDYTIDEARIEVVANIKGLGDFRYDQTGKFVHGEELEEATLRSGDYTAVIPLAERLLQNDLGPARLDQIVNAIQRARREGADANSAWKALALKVTGMTCEALGDTTQAIAAYEQAIAINPKVGAKRRLSALRKTKS
jgi:hypothetical protein